MVSRELPKRRERHLSQGRQAGKVVLQALLSAGLPALEFHPGSVQHSGGKLGVLSGHSDDLTLPEFGLPTSYTYGLGSIGV